MAVEGRWRGRRRGRRRGGTAVAWRRHLAELALRTAERRIRCAQAEAEALAASKAALAKAKEAAERDRLKAEGAALADARRRQVAEAAAHRKIDAGGASAETEALGWLAGKLGGGRTPADSPALSSAEGAVPSGLMTPLDLEPRSGGGGGGGGRGRGRRRRRRRRGGRRRWGCQSGARRSTMKRLVSHLMDAHWGGSVPQAQLARPS